MRSQAPGAALLHPCTVAALFTLAFNDHVLKRVYPGVVSGKLSDFAGVVFLPLFLHALLELASAHVWKKPLTAATGDRLLVGCVGVSLLMFALPEVWHPAEVAYRYGLGTLRWPFRALWALAAGDAWPRLRPVRATADVTDLLAMPMGLLALRIGRRSAARPAKSARRLAATAAFALFSLNSQRASAASQPFTHDGFYMSAEAGPGLLYANSSGSISNNFLQEVPSSAVAVAAPAMAFAFGGTFARYGLTLGGRVGVARGVHPVVSTLNTRFSIPKHDLLLLEIGPFAHYYPDLRRGLYFGASLGFAWLGLTGSSEGAAPGFSGSLEVGNGFFFARQWSLGAALRLSAARTSSFDGPSVGTITLLPALVATVTLH
jgi:hypothetical protein